MAAITRSAGPPPPGGDPGARVAADLSAQIDRMDAVMKQHPVLLTDKQVDEIGARLARGCSAWSGAMVKAANRRHYVLLLAVLFAAALVGALASWLAFGVPVHPVCAVTEAGGRLCGVWVVPEKAR